MLEVFRKSLSATKSVILVSLFLAASTCFSQTRRGDVITNIPFPFVVANRTLPPGRYTVTPIGETNLRIYVGKNQGVIVQTHSVLGKAPEGVTRVVFHRYGVTYFLSEVWVAANRTGSQLFPSEAERESAKRSHLEIAVLCALPAGDVWVRLGGIRCHFDKDLRWGPGPDRAPCGELTAGLRFFAVASGNNR